MTDDPATGIEDLVRTRLRGLRHANGMSLDDLAAASNVSPSVISRVETGKRTLSLELLVVLEIRLKILQRLRPSVLHVDMSRQLSTPLTS